MVVVANAVEVVLMCDLITSECGLVAVFCGLFCLYVDANECSLASIVLDSTGPFPNAGVGCQYVRREVVVCYVEYYLVVYQCSLRFVPD